MLAVVVVGVAAVLLLVMVVVGGGEMLQCHTRQCQCAYAGVIHHTWNHSNAVEGRRQPHRTPVFEHDCPLSGQVMGDSPSLQVLRVMMPSLNSPTTSSRVQIKRGVSSWEGIQREQPQRYLLSCTVPRHN